MLGLDKAIPHFASLASQSNAGRGNIRFMVFESVAVAKDLTASLSIVCTAKPTLWRLTV